MVRGQIKSLFRELSEIYRSCYNLFLQFLYIQKKKQTAYKLWYLCYIVLLLRDVTIYISNRLWNLVFLRIRMRSWPCEFNWEENLEKKAEAMEKVSMS